MVLSWTKTARLIKTKKSHKMALIMKIPMLQSSHKKIIRTNFKACVTTGNLSHLTWRVNSEQKSFSLAIRSSLVSAKNCTIRGHQLHYVLRCHSILRRRVVGRNSFPCAVCRWLQIVWITVHLPTMSMRAILINSTIRLKITENVSITSSLANKSK